MIATTITPEELRVLRHSLGIHRHGRSWTKPYRNHYIAAPGHHAWAVLEGLVGRGLMVARGPLNNGDTSFMVTEAGKDLAAVGGRGRATTELTKDSTP